MKVGVLALQGAFREHIVTFEALGITSVAVRLPEQLGDLSGLVIPGGESTAIGKLMRDLRFLRADPPAARCRNGGMGYLCRRHSHGNRGA